VLSLSGVAAVIWLEGINDFSKNGNATVEAVQAGMKEAVGRLRARIPGVRVIGATVTPAVGASIPTTASLSKTRSGKRSTNSFAPAGCSTASRISTQ